MVEETGKRLLKGRKVQWEGKATVREEGKGRQNFIHSEIFPFIFTITRKLQKLESERNLEGRTKLKTPTRLLRKNVIAGRNSSSIIHASLEKRKSENKFIEDSSCNKKLRFLDYLNFGKDHNFGWVLRINFQLFWSLHNQTLAKVIWQEPGTIWQWVQNDLQD